MDDNLILRLESAVARLEALSVKGFAGDASLDIDAGAPTDPAIIAFDDLVQQYLGRVSAAAEKIGGQVSDVTKVLRDAFAALKELLVRIKQTRKPDLTGLAEFLKPLNEVIMKANSMTEGRKSDFFNHLKAAADSLSALAWIAYTGKDCGLSMPIAHVEDSWQTAEFYNNKAEADENSSEKGQNRKRKLKTGPEADEKSMAGTPGVCYMSRIPPRMDPFSLRDILAQYGDIHRVYLTPQNPSAKGHKPHNRRGEDRYVEGWIEFTDKRVAKRVASMLNGEQIGGRRKRSWYYDLWNIKYLSKFKWDDLTEEIAYKNAIREQKLSMEISASKKERDFYLSKVDKARALSSIEERLKKKQKLQEESGTGSHNPVYKLPPKVMLKFPQNKPVKVAATESKSRLSKDTLAGVFGGS